MAINDNDPINFDSAIDYADLYNNDNSSSDAPQIAGALTSPFKSPSPATETHQLPSTSNTSPHISAGPAAASVTATALTTITSTIINNYSNHNNRNHKNLHQNHDFNNSLSNHSRNHVSNDNSNQSSSTWSLLKSLSHQTSNGSSSDQIFNSNFSNNMNDSAKTPLEGGSNFMLLLEDFGEYFYNYNGSDYQNSTISIYPSNCSLPNSNCTEVVAEEAPNYNYWALILVIFPFLTLFGNVLVILAVLRERTLQTVTNYFIVSLAIADLLVAVVVMPFGVYILVNAGAWLLPNVVCDFYIAMDVICSTSSIFNLVAISIDRYIAVTQPIKYAKHKNSRRVCLTILLVWAISAAIGSPIVLGLNNTPDRLPDLCVFYNSDFIMYSSLSSFYIPCIIMVFLYWSIFKALRTRARKQRAARKHNISDLTAGGSIIENIAQTRRLAETTMDGSSKSSKIIPEEEPTRSGSNDEDEENAGSPDAGDEDCHVIVNDKSTEFMLATVVEEASKNVIAQLSAKSTTDKADTNGNHDSGYAPSNLEDILAVSNTPPGSPHQQSTVYVNKNAVFGKSTKNGSTSTTQASAAKSKQRFSPNASPKREPFSVALKPLSVVRQAVSVSLSRNDSTLSAHSRESSRKDNKNVQASRFTIYKVNKASKKKREKSSAKKERKATKTLAIVLGVFLICWLPFFSCNIMDALCTKLNYECQPGVTAFILTTWLGYMNSFVNPVIYTIFNPEFRKAFKKILAIG